MAPNGALSNGAFRRGPPSIELTRSSKGLLYSPPHPTHMRAASGNTLVGSQGPGTTSSSRGKGGGDKSGGGDNAGGGGPSVADRLARLYRQQHADADGHVDDRHAAKFVETSMLAAVTAKYGTDANRVINPPLRSAMMSQLEYVNPEAPPSQDAVATLFAGGKGREQRVDAERLPGGPVLAHLVLHHLATEGLHALEQTMVSEMRTAGLSHEYYSSAMAPINLRTDAGQSALAMLLCPMSLTRQSLLQLAEDTPGHIRATVSGPQINDVCLALLTEMALEPMWADVGHGQKSQQRMYVAAATGHVLAAPLNQLVEHLTAVRIVPHVSMTEAMTEHRKAFTRRFFLTHRHMTDSRTLLVKLIQRAFVPISLNFTDQFEGNGITISVPDTQAAGKDVLTALAQQGGNAAAAAALSDFDPLLVNALYSMNGAASPLRGGGRQGAVASNPVGRLHPSTNIVLANAKASKYHAQVTRLVHIQVLSCILFWLKHHPGHFDALMHQAVLTFLDELCYSPGIWSEAPAELAQGAEQIKLAIRASAQQLDSQRSGGLPTSSSSGRLAGVSASRESAGKKSATVDFLFTLQHRTKVGIAGMPDDMRGDALGLLHVDDARLANQITTFDHALLRRIKLHELTAHLASAHTRTVQSSFNPAMNVAALLSRGEATSLWAVTEILIALTAPPPSARQSDAQQPASASASTVPLAAAVLAKFIALIFRLIEVNNLHSAFAIFCGLRHPCIARLTDTWDLLSASARRSFAELVNFFGFENGYRNYQDYIDSVSDAAVYPIVPVLAVTMDELRRLEGAEATVLRDAHGGGVVHWRKLDVLGELYGRFLAFQEAPIPAEFELHEACLMWMNEQLAKAIHDPEKLCALSFRAQPTGSKGRS